MNQPGSTQVNPEKLKKKKNFNILYEKIKKIHVNIGYIYYK
jgi:hypothetical protein